MSVVTIMFDDIDLSNILEIHDVQRAIGNNRNITSSGAKKIGTHIQEIKIEPKKIIVDFSIWSKDRNTLKHKLAGIFNVDEPKRLIFSDEPDKYYLAVVVNDIDMIEVSNYRSQGSIEFYIPDGTAHSSTYKRVVDYTKEGSNLVFDIENNGNVDALPIFTVKNNSENGYIGIVNQNGALEVGNPEEMDGKIVNKNKLLFDYRGNKIVDALANGEKNVMVSNVDHDENNNTGGLKIENWEGRNHIGSTRSSFSGAVQTASLTFDVSTDDNNLHERVWWRQVFWAGSVRDYGFIKVTVSDDQGNFLYGTETFKRSIGVESEYNFLVSDGAGGFRITDRKKFRATNQDKDNPFNVKRGWSDITRNNKEVTFFWWGGYIKRTVPEIENIKAAKVHIAIGQMQGKTLVTRCYIDEIFFEKRNVAVEEDIPNLFPIGSTLEINTENNTVVVDGIFKNDYFVDGSDFITIPPGKSKLYVSASSWVDQEPSVTINFEERWL
ncbi:distal tail protein Dit [Streptococcus hyovaginalis]|uniref:distal tail protein Dit n=1 Tax=Streptococcus hyovaginalis TaxID=149015 RepID=UPI002A81E701|nr:distal tail protein Dit [Streptococcus hyovaginalis]MDY4510977.1 phage tail family protein [Streptococcus hyovaginalis]